MTNFDIVTQVVERGGGGWREVRMEVGGCVAVALLHGLRAPGEQPLGEEKQWDLDRAFLCSQASKACRDTRGWHTMLWRSNTYLHELFETVCQDFSLNSCWKSYCLCTGQSTVRKGGCCKMTRVLGQLRWKPSAMDACVHRFCHPDTKELAGAPCVCMLIPFGWEEIPCRTWKRNTGDILR